MCTCLAPLHFQFLLLKWSKACLVWIYWICPLQTTLSRIKCSCFEIPMLSHIHIMCYSICNWTQHHVAWYLIPTRYGNILPDGMGMSYLCGMGMSYLCGMGIPYQMEWECRTYVVWEYHTRWNGNPIPYWNDRNGIIPYHNETIP